MMYFAKIMEGSPEVPAALDSFRVAQETLLAFPRSWHPPVLNPIPIRLIHVSKFTAGVSQVTWEIEPVGDSCLLNVTHDRLRDSANAQLYGGWPMILVVAGYFDAAIG
jgi:hypothetical protein